MCTAPITVYVGLKGDKFPVETSCHECWQCRNRAIQDWQGRNIAEQKKSLAAHVITLTYGRNKAGDVNHERSSLLTYSDVQKYLKLLRRHGYPVRYFVAGEYGSLNGRAHWHIILYWQKKVPPLELGKDYMEPHWPHGWSFVEEAGPGAVRYVCKYLQKDMGDMERQGHLSMSKKPPIGAAYFADLAKRYVAQGISPQTLTYRFPDVTRRKPNGSREVIDFMLADRSAELYLGAFIAEWQRVHGNNDWPHSELVECFHQTGRIILDPNRAERLYGDRAGGYRRYVEQWKADNAKPKKPRARLAWRWDPGAFERMGNNEQQRQQGQPQQGQREYRSSYVERDRPDADNWRLGYKAKPDWWNN